MPGCRLRHIAQLLDHRPHPNNRRFGDWHSLVEHPADGRDRHARRCGDIIDGHRRFRPRFRWGHEPTPYDVYAVIYWRDSRLITVCRSSVRDRIMKALTVSAFIIR